MGFMTECIICDALFGVPNFKMLGGYPNGYFKYLSETLSNYKCRNCGEENK